MALTASLTSLDEALNDLDIEDEGHVPVFYWDTSHVRNALLGRTYYYDVEAGPLQPSTIFDAMRFSSDRALIYSLASAEWFGRLRLLQPHQAELVKLVNRGFGIGSAEIPVGGVPQFLKDVGLGGIDHLDIDHLGELPKERIAAIVRTQVGQASRLFNVVQAIRHRSWKERLAYWLRMGIFQPETAKYDYQAVMKLPLFERLHSAFEKHRSDKNENNLADTIAMCQLHDKVDAYRRKHSNECPVFLASPIYRRIFESSGLSDHFAYDFRGKRLSVFRTEEYFKFRATIIKPHRSYDTADPRKQSERLGGLRRELEELRRTESTDTGYKPQRLSSQSTRVPDLVREVQNYSFLEEVWLPYASETEVIEVISAYFDSSKTIHGSSAFQDELDGQVAGFIEEIKDVSKQLEVYTRLWKELHAAIRQKLERFDKERPQTNLAVLSGLFRFGFPHDLEVRMNDLFAKTMAEDLPIRSKATLEILRMVPDVSTQDWQTTVVAAGVMWALGLFGQVKGMLDGVKDGHISVRILFAAASLQMNEVSACQSVIEELEEEFRKTVHSEGLLDLATSLVYLYFHLRRCYVNSRTRLNAKELRGLSEKAVSFARVAREQAPDPWRLAYAINQQLYCMVSDNEGYPRQEVMDLAAALLEFDGSGEVWQYRYDDTLATYYEWMASAASDKRRWLDLAMKRVESALKSCAGEDSEVERHLQKILVAREGLRK